MQESDMPSQRPSTSIWAEMSDVIGCDVPSIKAVFEVEAAGKFYESNGSLPRRFEPHHFPRKHWGAIGFNPGKRAPWRAALRIKTSARRRMFDIAEGINAEATYRASSWGAPQIMGFNYELAGFQSATDMIDAFEQSADEQIRAFVSFVMMNDLDTHMRSQDWVAFAAGYNGNGQAEVYGAKIETAYRRQSGGRASSPILRMNSKGAAVRNLQRDLTSLGYDADVDGSFGAGTRRAVRSFQSDAGLKVDGVAGNSTLSEIKDSLDAMDIEPEKVERVATASTFADLRFEKIIERGTAVVGAGGVTGVLANLNDNAQTIVIGGAVLGAIVIAALFIMKKRSA